MEYTLNYIKTEEGTYVGHLMELPGVATQAESLDGLKENIKDALKCMLIVLKEDQENEPILMGWEVAKKIKVEL